MLIKGGHIVDPVTGTDEILDIRIGQDRKDPEEKAAREAVAGAEK